MIEKGRRFGCSMLFAAAMIFISSSGWAATYYVSSVSGSDTNGGLSATSPWKTIAKVNSVKFASGDQILFKCGEIWREQLKPSSSGSAGSPITFGSYGTGSKPSIRGSNTFNAAGNWTLESGSLWYLSSVSHNPGVFVHDGILGQSLAQKASLGTQWDYWYDATDARLYVFSSANPATLAANLEAGVRQYVIGPQSRSYITFDNLDIRHAYGVGWLGWGATNVVFQNCSFTQSGGDHLLFHDGSNYGLVSKCAFDDWGVAAGKYYAVHAQGYGSTYTGPVDVADCTFTTTSTIASASGSEHTVIMQDTNSWIRNVQRNTIDGNAGKIHDDGIVIWDSCSAATSHLVESNVVKNIGGIAITIQQLENHGAHPGVIVRYNNVQNVCLSNTSDKSAIRLRKFSSACSVSVYYNLIDGTPQGANPEPGIDLSAAGGPKIYNNTIYGVDDGILVRNSSSLAAGMNNILLGNRGAGIDVDTTSSATTDYNCPYANAKGSYSGVKPGAHDVAANPLVTDAGSGNFHLTSKSPCIDSGVSVGLTRDFDNNAVPYGKGTDIGAFEYSTTTIQAPAGLTVN